MGFLKKIWKKIRKVIAIILIIVAVIFFCYAAAVYFGVMSAVTIGSATITAGTALAIGVGALAGAFLLDKTAASKAVSDIGSAVGSAAAAVAGFATGAIASAASGAVGGAIKGGGPILGIIVIGGIAYLGYKLITSYTKDRDAKAERGELYKDKGESK